MINNKKKNTSRWFAAGFMGLLLILSAGLLMVAAEHTFMNYYLWFGVMAALGAVSAIPCVRLWQWLTSDAPRWLCGVLHTVFFVIFLSGLFIGLNFLLTDFNSLPTTQAEVMRKYSETHYRSRRVGRNRYTRGEPYNVYKVEFRLADGRLRTFQLPLSRYNKLRPGHTAELRCGPGALGIPVIALE